MPCYSTTVTQVPSQVSLHPRACTCETCQPYLRRFTTCSMPTQQIIISRQQWIALGQPKCIEDIPQPIT